MPIGQVIPFGPWLQYPFGFLSLERYCWWLLCPCEPHLCARSTSLKMEDCTERLVHGRQLASGEMTDQIAESFGIDCGGLLDQDVGGLSLHFDLWAEARRSRAGGCGRDEPSRQRQEVRLNHDRVAVPALLVTPRITRRFQSVHVTTHVGNPCPPAPRVLPHGPQDQRPQPRPRL